MYIVHLSYKRFRQWLRFLQLLWVHSDCHKYIIFGSFITNLNSLSDSLLDKILGKTYIGEHRGKTRTYGNNGDHILNWMLKYCETWISKIWNFKWLKQNWSWLENVIQINWLVKSLSKTIHIFWTMYTFVDENGIEFYPTFRPVPCNWA